MLNEVRTYRHKGVIIVIWYSILGDRWCNEEPPSIPPRHPRAPVHLLQCAPSNSMSSYPSVAPPRYAITSLASSKSSEGLVAGPVMALGNMGMLSGTRSISILPVRTSMLGSSRSPHGLRPIISSKPLEAHTALASQNRHSWAFMDYPQVASGITAPADSRDSLKMLRELRARQSGLSAPTDVLALRKAPIGRQFGYRPDRANWLRDHSSFEYNGALGRALFM